MCDPSMVVGVNPLVVGGEGPSVQVRDSAVIEMHERNARDPDQ